MLQCLTLDTMQVVCADIERARILFELLSLFYRLSLIVGSRHKVSEMRFLTVCRGIILKRRSVRRFLRSQRNDGILLSLVPVYNDHSTLFVFGAVVAFYVIVVSLHRSSVRQSAGLLPLGFRCNRLRLGCLCFLRHFYSFSLHNFRYFCPGNHSDFYCRGGSARFTGFMRLAPRDFRRERARAHRLLHWRYSSRSAASHFPGK